MIPQNFLKAIATEHKVSNAELEVLSLAMEGESMAAIASQLHISGDAVRKRLSEVYQKFQIQGKGPVKLTKLQQHLILQYRQRANLTALFANDKRDENTRHRNNIDWGNAPDVAVFFGRTSELATLSEWLVERRCRLVALLGMGGIGKTALAIELAKQIQEQFDYVVWRSLSTAPTLDRLLDNLIQTLQPQAALNGENIEQKISQLITHCQTYRCLIVLDGVEAVLSQKQLVGTYLSGYENYGQFFHRLGEEASKSCILLTSREKIGEIAFQEGSTSPVRSLHVRGLGENARLLLQEKELLAAEAWQTLIESYQGNPLMLKLAAPIVQEVFDGNVEEFLATTLFPNSVTDFVGKMLGRLSELECQILVAIAKHQEPISIKELLANLTDVSASEIIDAIASLKQRSFVEKAADGFVVAPVVREVAVECHC